MKTFAQKRMTFASDTLKRRYKRLVKKKKKKTQSALKHMAPTLSPTLIDVFGGVWYGDHVKVSKVGEKFFVYTPFEKGYRR